MMHWNGEVSAGHVLLLVEWLVGLAVAYHRFVLRIDVQAEGFRRILQAHADTLAAHAARLDNHEAHSFEMVADLQRLVGRVEAGWQADRLHRESADPP
jgi:hypothetical protein